MSAVNLISHPSRLPIAFTFDGKRYNRLRDLIPISEETEGRTTRSVGLFADTLTVTTEVTRYEGYDALCYSVKLENRTDKVAPRLSEVASLSMGYIGREPVLCGIFGDGGADERGAYAPYAFPMYGEDAKPIHMEPTTGRGTYNYFPYFHIQSLDGGLFVALGHPILWKADFTPETCPEEDGTHVPSVGMTMGQATLDVALAPGESVTLPSVTLLFHGAMDTDTATNHWRHFFMDCIMRRIDGALFPPHMSGGTSWLYAEMRDATEANQIAAMDTYLSHGIPIDYWWMDAGWYFRREGEQLESWMETGTWLPDTHRFPTSFAAISEHGETHGVKTLLWFEPEMARLPSEDFGPRAMDPANRLLGSPLMDMGNPAFVDWCFERFSSILDAGKISLYRQDYGVNPEAIFKHETLNPDGHAGYTENRYARGYYALWDKMIERYPNRMIDSCAAGGGRNDIDSMRRAVPLHKTDHDYSRQNDKQSMHMSLFAWLPYFGAVLTGPDRCEQVTPYIVQSTYCPWMALTANVLSDAVDWACLKTYTDLWWELSRYYYADYYPLTPWSRGDTDWRGWEFYDPASGGGFIQLFRPACASEDTCTVPLKGLDPTATYEICNRETNELLRTGGQALLETGISVHLATPESAVVLTVRRI